MTRQRILRAFTDAYLAQLSPEARIAFLRDQLLAVTDPDMCWPLHDAAQQIGAQAHQQHLNRPVDPDLTLLVFPQPHGVSP